MNQANKDAKDRRYLMIVGGEERWLSLGEAGVMYDNGHVSVSIGGKVMEPGGSVRPITPEERQRISDIADEYSANK